MHHFGCTTRRRVSERQIEAFDALADESNSTRTAVIQRLVGEPERQRVAPYAAGIRLVPPTLTQRGDLGTFRANAKAERVGPGQTKTSGSPMFKIITGAAGGVRNFWGIGSGPTSEVYPCQKPCPLVTHPVT